MQREATKWYRVRVVYPSLDGSERSSVSGPLDFTTASHRLVEHQGRGHSAEIIASEPPPSRSRTAAKRKASQGSLDLGAAPEDMHRDGK